MLNESVGESAISSADTAGGLTIGKILVAVWLCLWSLATFAADAMVLSMIAQTMLAWSYPAAPGTVIASAVRHEARASGDVVQADVTYQFHVNGQEVTGSRLSFFDVRQGEEQDAAFVVKSLPVGKSVEVFYNSHEPTDCALSRSLAGRPLYLGLLLLPFHLVMVASWRWAVRKHRGVRDLPMRLEGDRWIVRRAHGSPIVVALIAASVLDLGEIVVLNSTNLSTNIVATSLAWLILIGLTWLAYRHTWSSARSEPPALIADNIARTLSWPTAGSDQTVAVAQLHAVELDETVTTTANGDVNVDFAVIVKYGADDGQIMTRSVLMTTNGHEAEILVDWLEDWTGLKQS